MNKSAETARAIIGFIYAVIASLIGLRFVFRLLDANPGNDFVDFIYDFSQPLVAPFETIFDDPAAGSGSVFDSAAVVALLVYGLVSWLGLWLIKAVATPSEVESKTAKPSRDDSQRDV